ncbi:uncharacterized protein [Halyomorpha halys]|uniref:uncharacterized protein n=1 Tax=Halyomorpha halys TaxID=286706 RepID=UPI0006D4F357|nr:uncharacterized protein LOC106681570 [Halyomorpha halys]
MCEVRRVFHNVNSDSNTALPLSSIKKPVVKFCDQLNSENIEQEIPPTKESLPSNVLDENGRTKKNLNAKKNHKSLQNDFSEPRLLTSLKIIESITSLGQDINKGKLPKQKSRASSGERKKKASSKVNIPFEERVYRGLIELQVTDEDLGLRTHVPTRRKEFIKNKEPEPVLSNFYKPKFDQEYIIKPGVPKFEINPIFVTDIPSILAATKKWEPEKH